MWAIIGDREQKTYVVLYIFIHSAFIGYGIFIGDEI